MNSKCNLECFRKKRIVKILSVLLLQSFLFYNISFAAIERNLPSPNRLTSTQKKITEEILLAPYLISRLVPLSEKELDDLDRRVKGTEKRYPPEVIDARALADRVAQVKQNWINKYIGAWIEKAETLARERSIELDRDILFNAFLIAFNERAEDIGLLKPYRDGIDVLAKEEIARLRPGSEIRTPGTGHARTMVDVTGPLTDEEQSAINKAIADTMLHRDGKIREVYMEATGGVFVVLDDEIYKEHARKHKAPLDVICHPGTRGTKDNYYKTGRYEDVERRYYITNKIFDILSHEEKRTLARHEEMHIKIALGIEEVPKGMTEEEFINQQPGCDISHIMARRLGSIGYMENILNSELEYGDAAKVYIEEKRREIEGLRSKGEKKKAQRIEKELKEFIKTVYMRRWNTEFFKSILSKEPYLGYDVIIISSTTEEEARYQKQILERAFRGITTANVYLKRNVCILSVVDKSEGGQIIGQVNTWKEVVRQFDKWAKGKKVDYGGEEPGMLDRLFKDNRIKIAAYHNGGKGERGSPATQSLGNSRGAQRLVGYVLDSHGEKTPLELILGVVLQTSPFALKNGGNRIDTFWTNQLVFGTIDFSDIERSNCALDKFYIEIDRDNIELIPKRYFFDYGTARLSKDGRRTLGFLANKYLARRSPKTGKWELNPEFEDDYNLLIKDRAKTPRAAFDYGPFSYSREMHYALMEYWEKVQQIFRIMHKNRGRAGRSRDIDPALVQVLVPMMNGIVGREFPQTLSALKAETFLNMPEKEREWLLERLFEVLPDEYEKALRKVKKVDYIYETIGFLLFCKNHPDYKIVYESLINYGIGGINVGKNSHWFAYKRLLDMANEKFVMLTDLIGKTMAIDERDGEIIETVPPELWDKAKIWEMVKAEDARKMRRVRNDAIAVFEIDGERYELTAEEVRKGWWWKENVDEKYNIYIKGSVISGKTVLLPGSRIVNSVVCDSHGQIQAEHSYIESSTASKIEAVNSVIYQVIDSGQVKARREIVADVYRPDIKGEGRLYPKGQSRMRAPIWYDPQGRPYKDIVKPINDGKKEVVGIKVKDDAGNEYAFTIKEPTIEDGIKVYNVYGESGNLIGKYKKAVPVKDRPQDVLEREVWPEIEITKEIEIDDRTKKVVEMVERRRRTGNLVEDRLELINKHGLPKALEEELTKVLEQDGYYSMKNGNFAARPMSDYVLFWEDRGNEYSFHKIRQMPCNRSRNDKIEHDLRLKTFIKMLTEREPRPLTPDRRLQIWCYAYINGALTPQRHGSKVNGLQLLDLYAEMFGMSGLSKNIRGRDLKELQDLYAEAFGITMREARKELIPENNRKYLAYTKLILNVISYYKPHIYAEEFGIELDQAEKEVYDVIANALVDRYARRMRKGEVEKDKQKAKEGLHRLLHDRAFSDYHKTVQRLVVEAQINSKLEESLFYSFKDLKDNEVKGFIHEEMAKDRHDFREATNEPVKMGTSGVRGDVEKLTDMEIFIQFRAQAQYAKNLSDFGVDHPLAPIIKKGAVNVGDVIDLIGDLRPSTPRILIAIAAAFLKERFDMDFQGILPTPALAYHTAEKHRRGRKDGKGRAGVMVTGSHNPYNQNGGKTYWGENELLKPEEPVLKTYVEEVRKEVWSEGEVESMFDDKGMFKKESEFKHDWQRELLTRAKKHILKKHKEPVKIRNLKYVYVDKEGHIRQDLSQEAAKMYIERYEAFGKPFRGKKGVFFEQSSVGRTIIPEILRRLGAGVISEKPADDFVQVDTENLGKPLDVKAKEGPSIKDKMKELAKKYPEADFYVTTDGDSDRPVFADETGEILYGDKLGVLTSLYLGLDFVACPISTNSKAVQKMVDEGIRVVLTKIGSPYIVEAIYREDLRKPEDKRNRRGGFEVNGGFLLGTNIELPNGKILKALPTRDATLPLICAMLYSMQYKDGRTASESIKETFSGKYEGYGFAGLVSGVKDEITPGCENYKMEMGPAIKERYSPIGIVEELRKVSKYELASQCEKVAKKIAEVNFKEGGVVEYEEIDATAGGVVRDKSQPKQTKQASPELAQFMLEIKDTMKKYFNKIPGLKDVEIERINYIDGNRIYFANEEIGHLRPLGNTAQFRIYTEAKTQEGAVQMVNEATKPTTGVLVQLINDYIEGSSKASAQPGLTKTPGTGAARRGEMDGKDNIGSKIEANKALLPVEETMRADIIEPEKADPPREYIDRRTVVLTKEGTTFERVSLVENKPFKLDLLKGKSQSTFVLEIGKQAEIVNEQGNVVAKLEKGTPVTIPITGTLSLEPKGATVVKVMYPETVQEEKSVFSVIEGIRSALEKGKIQERIKEHDKKGIQILMTHKLAGALYHSGTNSTLGHVKNEQEFLATESFLTQFLRIEVKITTGRDWEELLGRVDTANYLPVAWTTDKEIQRLENNQDILKGLAALPLVPISSQVVESLEAGGGWFYVRELEGLSLLLACITQKDIADNERIAYDLLRIINTMIAKPLGDINDLKSLLPLGEEELANLAVIQERFNRIIQRILITLPAKPFDPRDEIHRRRQVLWSV